MLKVRWIGILILAFSVSAAIQQDPTSDRESNTDTYRRFFMDSKSKNDHGSQNDYLDELLEYITKTDRAENKAGLLSEKSDLKKPKKIRITYKKRSKVGKKKEPQYDSESVEVKQLEKKAEEYLKSEDANLLPSLPDYLKRHKEGESNLGDDFTVLNDSTYHDHLSIINDKPKHLERNAEKESDLNKGKGNKPDENQTIIDNIIRMIHFPDKKLLTKERETHKRDPVTKKDRNKGYQENIGSAKYFSSILDNGNKINSYKWNIKQIKPDKKGKKSAKGLGTSNQEYLESKLCESSKTNLSEFWKLASRYFGSDNINLTDKQKYDVFLTILQKVKQEADGISPSKPETEDLSKQLMIDVPSAEKSKEFHQADTSKQDSKLKLTNAVFSDPNQKVVGDLGSKEIMPTNKNKLGGPEIVVKKEMAIPLNTLKNTSKEEKPNILLDIINPGETLVQTPSVLQTNQEPKRETANTSLHIWTFDKSHSNIEQPFLGNVIKSAIISSNKYPKFLEYPLVDSDFESRLLEVPENDPDIKEFDANKEKKQDSHEFDDDYVQFTIDKDSKKDTPQTDDVNYLLKPKEEESLLKDASTEISNLSSEEHKIDSDKQILDIDLSEESEEDVNSADDPGTTLEAKKKSSTDNALESSSYLSEDLRTILEAEIFDLEDSEKSENSKETNSKRLALLLQHLKGLPKDQLLRIVLYLQAKKKSNSKLLAKNNFALKNLHATNKNLSDTDLDHSTDWKRLDGLKFLSQGLKDQPEVEVENVFPDLLANQDQHLKLVPKYNVTSKENDTDANQLKKQADRSLKDSTSTSVVTDTDEKSLRPKMNFKWNIRSRNDLTKVLLDIISKFEKHGVSDLALREIILYLSSILTEDDGKCQTKELNRKLNDVKKAFVNLLTLNKKAKPIKKV